MIDGIVSSPPAPDTHAVEAAERAIASFRAGLHEAAMPDVVAAALAGEPRCRYLLGVALHNGDLLPRDERLARAMLASAAESGVAPARDALAAIDGSAADAAPAPTASGPDELLAALIRPLLGARLDRLLPVAIGRAVAAAGGSRDAAQPNAASA